MLFLIFMGDSFDFYEIVVADKRYLHPKYLLNNLSKKHA